MGQLKVKNLLAFAQELLKNGMTIEEIGNLPIYLGNDDELNGIHCGWYTNLVDANDTEDEDNVYTIELINENRCNIKLEKGKAILIS
jgi:hypothetical protein